MRGDKIDRIGGADYLMFEHYQPILSLSALLSKEF